MTFFFTCLFMWLVFWRPQEWLVPAMFGWPVLDVIVGFAVLTLAVEINEGRLRVPKQAPQVMLLTGLWLSAPLSHLSHTYFGGMIDSIEPIFKICFFTFLLIVVIRRPAQIRTVSLLFVAMGTSMAIHAHLQMTRGYGFGGLPPIWVPAIDLEPEYYRAMFFGIFSDPNDLAQFLATCMPLTFVIARRHNVGAWLFAVGLCWLFYHGIILTDSRGGQVAVAAIIGMEIVMLFPHRWFPYLTGLGLLGFLVMCFLFGDQMDASAASRPVFWGLANQMFKHNPIFGIGYEMAWMVTEKGEALHNAFVTCYTELGLFGYWFWFLLIQIGIVGAWRTCGALARSKDPDAQWLRRLAKHTLCAMFGFCASAYFLSRTFIFPLFFLMAMLGVIPVMAQAYLPPNHPPLIDKRRDLYRNGTIGVFISVSYIYVSCKILNMAYF